MVNLVELQGVGEHALSTGHVPAVLAGGGVGSSIGLEVYPVNWILGDVVIPADTLHDIGPKDLAYECSILVVGIDSHVEEVDVLGDIVVGRCRSVVEAHCASLSVDGVDVVPWD